MSTESELPVSRHHRSRTAPRTAALLVSLLLAVGSLGLIAPTAASADPTSSPRAYGGSITGQVTGFRGSKLQGITVLAFTYTNQAGWTVVQQTGTDASGVYTFDGLYPADYAVYFADQGRVYANQYWDPDYPVYEIEEAALVHVVEGSLTSGVNRSLDRRATIRGSVTAEGGAPLESAGVHFWLRSEKTGVWHDHSVSTTDSAGHYENIDLPAGTYRLQFSQDHYADEFWDNRPSLESSDDIRISSFSPGTANAVMSATPPPPAVVNLSPPRVTGQPRVGGTLVADTGAWSPAGVTLHLQWIRDSDPIPGATGTTYRLTAADVFGSISLRVVATKAGHSSRVRTADAARTVMRGVLRNTRRPAIIGRPVVGQRLTVDPGRWRPAGVHFSFQWLAGGAKVPGATEATFVPTRQQLGKRLRVRVRAKLYGYRRETVLTEASSTVGAPA